MNGRLRTINIKNSRFSSLFSGKGNVLWCRRPLERPEWISLYGDILFQKALTDQQFSHPTRQIKMSQRGTTSDINDVLMRTLTLRQFTIKLNFLPLRKRRELRNVVFHQYSPCERNQSRISWELIDINFSGQRDKFCPNIQSHLWPRRAITFRPPFRFEWNSARLFLLFERISIYLHLIHMTKAILRTE